MSSPIIFIVQLICFFGGNAVLKISNPMFDQTQLVELVSLHEVIFVTMLLRAFSATNRRIVLKIIYWIFLCLSLFGGYIYLMKPVIKNSENIYNNLTVLILYLAVPLLYFVTEIIIIIKYKTLDYKSERKQEQNQNAKTGLMQGMSLILTILAYLIVFTSYYSALKNQTNFDEKIMTFIIITSILCFVVGIIGWMSTQSKSKILFVSKWILLLWTIFLIVHTLITKNIDKTISVYISLGIILLVAIIFFIANSVWKKKKKFVDIMRENKMANNVPDLQKTMLERRGEIMSREIAEYQRRTGNEYRGRSASSKRQTKTFNKTDARLLHNIKDRLEHGKSINDLRGHPQFNKTVKYLDKIYTDGAEYELKEKLKEEVAKK